MCGRLFHIIVWLQNCDLFFTISRTQSWGHLGSWLIWSQLATQERMWCIFFLGSTFFEPRVVGVSWGCGEDEKLDLKKGMKMIAQGFWEEHISPIINSDGSFCLEPLICELLTYSSFVSLILFWLMSFWNIVLPQQWQRSKRTSPVTENHFSLLSVHIY